MEGRKMEEFIKYLNRLSVETLSVGCRGMLSDHENSKYNAFVLRFAWFREGVVYCVTPYHIFEHRNLVLSRYAVAQTRANS